MKKFREHLKEIRANMGWTQEQLSSIYGIPKRTIEDWERGLRTPPLWTRKMILSYFKKETEMKVFEIWNTNTNEKITEIEAYTFEDAYTYWIDNFNKYYCELEESEIRYRPVI